MGFLMDIRTGKRGTFGVGVYAIVFWLLAGMGLGVGGAMLLQAPEKAATLFMVAGALIGLAVGFYAAWGTSTLAKILDVPGGIVALLGWH